jgi:hypothetical protein
LLRDDDPRLFLSRPSAATVTTSPLRLCHLFGLSPAILRCGTRPRGLSSDAVHAHLLDAPLSDQLLRKKIGLALFFKGRALVTILLCIGGPTTTPGGSAAIPGRKDRSYSTCHRQRRLEPAGSSSVKDNPAREMDVAGVFDAMLGTLKFATRDRQNSCKQN